MIEEKYKVISLPARYGLKHTLRLLESKKNLVYKLELDLRDGNYLRSSYSPGNPKEIMFIDPPGGPMIYLGDSLEVDKNYKLIDIHFDNGPILTYGNF